MIEEDDIILDEEEGTPPPKGGKRRAAKSIFEYLNGPDKEPSGSVDEIRDFFAKKPEPKPAPQAPKSDESGNLLQRLARRMATEDMPLPTRFGSNPSPNEQEQAREENFLVKLGTAQKEYKKQLFGEATRSGMLEPGDVVTDETGMPRDRQPSYEEKQKTYEILGEQESENAGGFIDKMLYKLAASGKAGAAVTEFGVSAAQSIPLVSQAMESSDDAFGTTETDEERAADAQNVGNLSQIESDIKVAGVDVDPFIKAGGSLVTGLPIIKAGARTVEAAAPTIGKELQLGLGFALPEVPEHVVRVAKGDETVPEAVAQTAIDVATGAAIPKVIEKSVKVGKTAGKAAAINVTGQTVTGLAGQEAEAAVQGRQLTAEERIAGAATNVLLSGRDTQQGVKAKNFNEIHSKLMQAISSKESSGNYKAVNPSYSKSRKREVEALGKYQVMDYNLPSWSKELLGREYTKEEFLASPAAQEKLYTAKMGEYLSNNLKKYGVRKAVRESALDWYGRGTPTEGPSPGSYANDILKRFDNAKGGPLPEIADEGSTISEPQAEVGENGLSLTPKLAAAETPDIPGNIDLDKRPTVQNDDGSVSTVRSISVNMDGREYLIPTVTDDGRIVSNDEAVELFRESGKHLGAFSSPEAATRYAEALHREQEQQYAPSAAVGDEIKLASGKRATIVDIAKTGEMQLNTGEFITPEEFAAQAENVTRLKADIDTKAHEAATSPTNDIPEPSELQQQSGNYKKGHVQVAGFDVTIENPAGSVRKGVNAEGQAWETELKDHYGYIRRTKGADGDHVDVFIGSDPTSEKVFVIDQNGQEAFDEHKVILGATSLQDAVETYRRNYSDDAAERIGAVTETSPQLFKEWLKSDETKKPFAESTVNIEPLGEETTREEKVAHAKLIIDAFSSGKLGLGDEAVLKANELLQPYGVEFGDKRNSMTKKQRDAYDKMSQRMHDLAEATMRSQSDEPVTIIAQESEEVHNPPATVIEGPKVEASREAQLKLDLYAAENDNSVLAMKVFGIGSQKKAPKRDKVPEGNFVPEDPVVAQRLIDASRSTDPSTLERIRDNSKKFWNKVSRVYEHLPERGAAGVENAPLKADLMKLEKAAGIAENKTGFALRGMVADLKVGEQSDFRWKVIYDDMAESLEVAKAKEQPETLPFGYGDNVEAFKRDHEKINSIVEANPHLKESVDLYQRLTREIADEYLGLDKDVFGEDKAANFDRKTYFHHRVLKYAEEDALRSGKRATFQHRGWTQERTANELDYSTSFWDTMPKVLSEMQTDIAKLKFLKTVKDTYSEPTKLTMKELSAKITDAKGRPVAWEAMLPETHTFWSPKPGHSLFKVESVPENIIADAVSKEAATNKVPSDAISKALHNSSDRLFVVPKEVAATLDALGVPAQQSFWQKKIIKPWKWWSLFSPFRVSRYLTRNTFTDFEATVFNPGALKSSVMGKATGDLKNVFFSKKAPSEELMAYLNQGGLANTFNTTEGVKIKNSVQFAENAYAKGEDATPANIVSKVAKYYVKKVGDVNDYRENVLRYANFISYREQMQADLAAGGKGAPKNFGASNPNHVMALKDTDQRAYKLSNDLLGAYDNISHAGQYVARNMMPFYRFKEANLKRWYNLAANEIAGHTQATGFAEVGKAVAKSLARTIVRSPIIAARIGIFYGKASLLMNATQAWNSYVMGDDEEALPDDLRRTSHILLGRDDKGDLLYFNNFSGFSDALQSVGGFSEIDNELRQVLIGRKSLADAITTLTEDPEKTLEKMTSMFGNEWLAGFGPAQNVVEAVAGKKLYPDVFNPRPIRDKWEHLFTAVGLEKMYRLAAGKPTKTFGEELKGVFLYSMNQDYAALQAIRSKAYEFKDEKEGGSPSINYTDKANAAFYMKLGLRYGDLDAAKKYLLEFIRLSKAKDAMGLSRELSNSLDSMDPLSILTKAQRAEFVGGLTPEEQEQLKAAQEYVREFKESGQEFIMENLQLMNQ